MTNLQHTNYCGCPHCNPGPYQGETKRDRVKDVLVASLISKMEGDGIENYERSEAYEWACDTADEIFAALGISPNEQDKL